MAPIPVKRVVSVTSEDPLQPGKNLLWPSGGKKWLCAADNRTRRAEVEVELCKRARIATIDIANFGAAFVEVKVGTSEMAPEEYVTLLPQSSLRSVLESKTGRNKTKLASFKHEKLSTAAANQKWNRVRVVCRQPFHLTEQFGLQFIVFHSHSQTSSSDHGSSASLLSTPPQNPKHLLSPPSSLSHTPSSTPSRSGKELSTKFPHLPANGVSKTTSSAKTNKTPRRPLRDRENATAEGEEFEFSGVENQSRLFQNALKGNTSGSKPEESNPILQKVISERKRYAEAERDRQHQASSAGSCYQRKKLLVKELPKATGHSDFAASYEKGASNTKDVVGAFHRLSRIDNTYEIGNEPEVKWGWSSGGRRHKRSSPSHDGQWLTKRRKLNDMISKCREIIDRGGRDQDTGSAIGGEEGGFSDISAPSEVPPVTDEATYLDLDSQDSNTTEMYDYTDLNSEPSCDQQGADLNSEPSIGQQSAATAGDAVKMTECPVCGQIFLDYVIELHASSCGEEVAAGVSALVVLD